MVRPATAPSGLRSRSVVSAPCPLAAQRRMGSLARERAGKTQCCGARSHSDDSRSPTQPSATGLARQPRTPDPTRLAPKAGQLPVARWSSSGRAATVRLARSERARVSRKRARVATVDSPGRARRWARVSEQRGEHLLLKELAVSLALLVRAPLARPAFVPASPTGPVRHRTTATLAGRLNLEWAQLCEAPSSGEALNQIGRAHV